MGTSADEVRSTHKSPKAKEQADPIDLTVAEREKFLEEIELN